MPALLVCLADQTMFSSRFLLVFAAGLAGLCFFVSPVLQAQTREAPASKGQVLFENRCARCHGLGGDGSEGLAPPLIDVVEREIASRRDYLYSDAMKRKAGIWSEKALDEYLADPQAVIPGNEMDAIAPDPSDRQEIIEYLKTLK
jgi:cytochrome c